MTLVVLAAAIALVHPGVSRAPRSVTAKPRPAAAAPVAHAKPARLAPAWSPPAAIRIATLPRRVRAMLRDAGVAGPVLSLIGRTTASTALYRAPYRPGGTCLMAVRRRGVGGADCNTELFTHDTPGYAAGGGVFSMDGHGFLRQLYGAASTMVASVWLLGAGVDQRLPLHGGRGGLVVFGSDTPPAAGRRVELRDASGRTVQVIRLL